jgi:hypothetical protein
MVDYSADESAKSRRDDTTTIRFKLDSETAIKASAPRGIKRVAA